MSPDRELATSSLELQVAGLSLRVWAPEHNPALRLPPAFAPFREPSPGERRIELTLRPEPPALPTSRPLFVARDAWRVHATNKGHLYVFESSTVWPKPYKAVWIDSRVTRGDLFYPTPGDSDDQRGALDFPLDELLFQHRLTLDGALVTHGAGLSWGDITLLFCGASGAGKSTFVRLWRERRPTTPVLSDDRVVLEPSPNGTRVHGTPWHGEDGLALPAYRPLSALFFLVQSTVNEARRLPPRAATARLLACSFFPIWDASISRSALLAAARVAENVPCLELLFRPDAEALDAVEAAARASRRG